jgi:hypothetical protein
VSADPTSILKRLAANYALGLVHSWDLPPVADRALSSGVYSPSLAELAATTNPIMSEVGPLFERAMNELGHPVPPGDEAAWIVARAHVERVATAAEPLREALWDLVRLRWATSMPVEGRRSVGNGLGIEPFMGIYWSLDELNENFYEPENRLIATEEERQAILDRDARKAAADWLRMHADRGLV